MIFSKTSFYGICSSLLVLTSKISGQQVTFFPPDFEFGASTSAYQIEGAWNVDGKGWSMWDYLVRTNPTRILDVSNGDIAANSYYNYKRDVEMLLELGVDNYRFSISWPRILPYGRPNYVNPLGVAYYNNLINELLANGITPYVTMYHWDLPQNLNEQGGWLNKEIEDWFGDYARVLYQHFGDRVKHWLTLNEPYIHCRYGYTYGIHAPLNYSPGDGYYECSRNYLLAHARAYHIYDNEFRATQHGEVGIPVSMEWGMIQENTTENQEALLDFLAYNVDMFMQPIVSAQGNFPERIINRVAANSLAEGFNASRLRPFTPEQVQYIKGTADLIGVNHYTTTYLYRNQSVNGRYEVPSLDNDKYYIEHLDPSWPTEEGYWGADYAPGFYNLLVYLRDTYPGIKFYITENGMGSPSTGLNDTLRATYYKNYLSAVTQALADGANVKGYFAWSLMDNFEWAFGYNIRFGLYEVDMADPERKRTPRKSALVYQNIVQTRVVDYSFDPDPYTSDAASVKQSNLLDVALGLMTLLYYTHN